MYRTVFPGVYRIWYFVNESNLQRNLQMGDWVVLQCAENWYLWLLFEIPNWDPLHVFACHAQKSLLIQKPTHKPAEFLYLDQLMEAWPHAAELHNVNNNNKINMCLIGNHGRQLTPVIIVNLIYNYSQIILLMFHSQPVVRHSNKC